MAYRDLREFLNKLEEERELVHIKQEVDWNLEAGAVIRRARSLKVQPLFLRRLKVTRRGSG